MVPHTDYHRRMLRDAGYGDVELHLNEWLCGDRSGYFWRRASLSSVIAAFIVSCQLAKNLLVANIYDARCAIGEYAPLFDPILKKPGKAFYALKYFNALYRLGRAVKCDVDGGQGADGLWAIAAKDAKCPRGRAVGASLLEASSKLGRDVSTKRPQAAACIVNDSPVAQPVAFDFGGREPKSCRIVDAKRTDAETALPSTLPPNSFMLVEFA